MVASKAFRVSYTPDVRDFKLGGALKNVTAIVVGICDDPGWTATHGRRSSCADWRR